MKKIFYLFFIVSLVKFDLFSQYIPSIGKKIEDFIPKGWDTLKVINCDFNHDGMKDIIAVLKNKEEDNFASSHIDIKRLLIVLLKEKNGYSLKIKNNNVIFCKTCGGGWGDPFEHINVKDNIITINHYGGSSWRWADTHKFRYQNEDWFLIGKTYYNYHNTEHCDSLDDFVSDYMDENLVTGNLIKKKINEQCYKTEKQIKRKPKPLIRLSDFDILKDINSNE